MDRNQLKPCGFFFLIYRFLTCWFWVVVHMLYHSNVPGFIIFFEASFSTTKNHSIVWDQNHFIVELFFFVRCWINAMSSMDISVLISSKIHPLYSNHSSLKTDVKNFSVKSVSALWQLNKHSDLSSFRTNVKVFMPREESVFLLLSSTDNPLTLCLLSWQAFAILSHDFWKNHFDQYRTRSKQYLEFVTILSRQRPNSFLWF